MVHLTEEERILFRIVNINAECKALEQRLNAISARRRRKATRKGRARKC